MNNLKQMKVGDSKTISVEGSINDSYFKAKNGHKVKRDEAVTIVNSNGQELRFYVHRIVGKKFIVLRETKSRDKLGFLDSLNLGWESAVNRSF
mgnify:CR=1 FL=1